MVFHPNAPSYLRIQPASLFRRHELEKKREYGDIIRSVECGSFTPLVFSTFGGLGREAIVFYSRLADLLAKKHGTPYSKTIFAALFHLIFFTVFCYLSHLGQQNY